MLAVTSILLIFLWRFRTIEAESFTARNTDFDPTSLLDQYNVPLYVDGGSVVNSTVPYLSAAGHHTSTERELQDGPPSSLARKEKKTNLMIGRRRPNMRRRRRRRHRVWQRNRNMKKTDPTISYQNISPVMMRNAEMMRRKGMGTNGIIGAKQLDSTASQTTNTTSTTSSTTTSAPSGKATNTTSAPSIQTSNTTSTPSAHHSPVPTKIVSNAPASAPIVTPTAPAPVTPSAPVPVTPSAPAPTVVPISTSPVAKPTKGPTKSVPTPKAKKAKSKKGGKAKAGKAEGGKAKGKKDTKKNKGKKGKKNKSKKGKKNKGKKGKVTSAPTTTAPTSAPTISFRPTTPPTAPPTGTPSTGTPTQQPTTAAPTTSTPTQLPTTATPTPPPTTLEPTTSSPTPPPTTSSPTQPPTTLAPTTSSPTQQPTTAQPTSPPTVHPTESPTVSHAPSEFPSTRPSPVPTVSVAPSQQPTSQPTPMGKKSKKGKNKGKSGKAGKGMMGKAGMGKAGTEMMGKSDMGIPGKAGMGMMSKSGMGMMGMAMGGATSPKPHKPTTEKPSGPPSITTPPPGTTASPSGAITSTVSPTGHSPSPSVVPTSSTSKFHITLDLSQVAAGFQTPFTAAAAKWESVIVGDVPNVTVTASDKSLKCGANLPAVIDDIFICASVQPIDGVGGILGSGGPLAARPGSLIPYLSSMTFDSADFGNSIIGKTVLHEMCHALGFVNSIWQLKGLINSATPTCTYAASSHASFQYQSLSGCAANVPAPIEQTGGQGTWCTHWSETCFQTELMTGFATGTLPLSVVTVGAMEDLGYTVNYNAADPYTKADMGASCVCKRRQLRNLDERPVTRRQLSERGRQRAMEYGLNHLTQMREDKKQYTGPGVFVADQYVSVLYMEDGEIYSISVDSEMLDAYLLSILSSGNATSAPVSVIGESDMTPPTDTPSDAPSSIPSDIPSAAPIVDIGLL